jgi:hypothetical protein
MKKYDLAIKTGSYQSNSGETKNRYENVGEIHAGKDGGFYARVNPFRLMGLCMAAIARGDDSMLVSLFAVKNDDSGAKTENPYRHGEKTQSSNNAQESDDFDDDIPF